VPVPARHVADFLALLEQVIADFVTNMPFSENVRLVPLNCG